MERMLLAVAIISLLSAIFWLVIYYIWNNHPEMVTEYDQNLPETYINHITRLETRTFKGKDPEDTFKRHQILAKALQGTTSLHRFYPLYNKTQIFMINYLIEQDRIDDALKLSDQWQTEYPYEFEAKYKYYEVLKSQDNKKALQYLTKVYEQYKDIDDVNDKLFIELLKSGDYKQAFSVVKAQQDNYIDNSVPSFMFFYKDNEYKIYQSKTKVYPGHTNMDDKYEVQMSQKFENLKGIRFDIDGIKVGSEIKAVEITLINQDKTFNDVAYRPLHHLKKLTENSFQTIGADPYFEIILPDEITNDQQELQVSIKLTINTKSGLVINKLLNHQDWKIYYSTSQKFDKTHSQHFTPHQDNHQPEKLSTLISIPHSEQKYQSIRVDFAPYIGMKIHSLNVHLGQKMTLNMDDISRTVGMDKVNNELIVKTNDPYVIFYLSEEISVDQVSVSFVLGGYDE